VSACDQRAYYPTTNGLFKLRSSDGDLVWECRPVDRSGSGLLTVSNVHVDRLSSGPLVVSGAENGLANKGLIVTETDSLVSAVTETGAVDVTGILNENIHLAYDSNDDYIYLCGQIGEAFVTSWLVNKFDHSGMFLGSREFPNRGAWGIRARDGEHFDILFPMNGGSYRIRRYELTGAFVAESATLIGFGPQSATDHKRRLLTDGTNYWGAQGGGGGIRIDADTLATVLTNPSSGMGNQVSGGAEYRDGLIVCSTGAATVRVLDSTSLALVWSYAGLQRIFGVSVCSDFVAVAMSVDTDPFHLHVSRIDGGTLVWDREFRVASSLVTFVGRDDKPNLLISQDATKVYIWGDFHAHETFTSSGTLRTVLYCLDATDGSILWCFSAGPTTDSGGTNLHVGMSLHDEGDYVYLGAQRCRAPTYR
jgi:outer membrane protein assembly factor BamB